MSLNAFDKLGHENTLVLVLQKGIPIRLSSIFMRFGGLRFAVGNKKTVARETHTRDR